MKYAGMDSITNVRKGSMYGNFAKSSNTYHKNYGMITLYTLFLNYLNNGARPFTFDDLCNDFEIDTSKKVDVPQDCPHKKLHCKNCKHEFY